MLPDLEAKPTTKFTPSASPPSGQPHFRGAVALLVGLFIVFGGLIIAISPGAPSSGSANLGAVRPSQTQPMASNSPHADPASQEARTFGEATCEPVTFAIGSIDPRFPLTEPNAERIAQQAAALWNTAAGTDLLRFDRRASLTISFVYDRRQWIVDRNKALQIALDRDENQLNALQRELRLESRLIDQAEAAHASDVAFWNQMGGAPEPTYTELQTDAAVLRERVSAYNARVRYEEQLVSKVNASVNQLNLFKGKSTEGEYELRGQKESISIFSYSDDEQLRHVIAHELGHALGLDHFEESGSIMSAVREDDTTARSLTSRDLSELRSACGVST